MKGIPLYFLFVRIINHSSSKVLETKKLSSTNRDARMETDKVDCDGVNASVLPYSLFAPTPQIRKKVCAQFGKDKHKICKSGDFSI